MNKDNQPEPEVFINRATSFKSTVVYNKLGVGPLKREVDVLSEGSIIEHASGKRSVVVWQNLTLTSAGFEPLGGVVQDTMDEFVRVAGP